MRLLRSKRCYYVIAHHAVKDLTQKCANHAKTNTPTTIATCSKTLTIFRNCSTQKEILPCFSSTLLFKLQATPENILDHNAPCVFQTLFRPSYRTDFSFSIQNDILVAQVGLEPRAMTFRASRKQQTLKLQESSRSCDECSL